LGFIYLRLKQRVECLEALGEGVHEPSDIGMARGREVVVVAGAALLYRVEAQGRRVAAHEQQFDADGVLQVVEVLVHLCAPCSQLGGEEVVVLVAACERLQTVGVADPVGLEQREVFCGNAHAA